MFKVGDIVIRTTGGNKMRVMEITDEYVLCGWICELYIERQFKQFDLMLYESYVKYGERLITINEILN